MQGRFVRSLSIRCGETYTEPVIGSTLCQRAATAVPPHSWAGPFSSLTPRPPALRQFSLWLSSYFKLRKHGPWVSNTSTPVSGKDCSSHRTLCSPCDHQPKPCGLHLTKARPTSAPVTEVSKGPQNTHPQPTPDGVALNPGLDSQ